jgi:hypothetical protein
VVTMATFMKASDLPPVFRIPSEYHAVGAARAERIKGTRRVRVTWLGHSVILAPSARVLVCT